jgi:hypothetical protein
MMDVLDVAAVASVENEYRKLKQRIIALERVVFAMLPYTKGGTDADSLRLHDALQAMLERDDLGED